MHVFPPSGDEAGPRQAAGGISARVPDSRALTAFLVALLLADTLFACSADTGRASEV